MWAGDQEELFPLVSLCSTVCAFTQHDGAGAFAPQKELGSLRAGAGSSSVSCFALFLAPPHLTGLHQLLPCFWVTGGAAPLHKQRY